MNLHLGFTGTKEGITQQQQQRLKLVLKSCKAEGYLWMHNGDCIGADVSAAGIWADLNQRIMLHPPENNRFRAFIPYTDIVCPPRGYMDRNQDIVDCSQLLVATPKEYKEQLRSGTWSTIRRARKTGLILIIIYPDGSIGES